MPTKVTFTLPDALKAKMDAHPEVNWSEVFRQAIGRHVERIELAARIQEEMDDPRVREVAQALREGTARRFEEAARRAKPGQRGRARASRSR